MAKIYYELEGFGGTLPNGTVSPARGDHSATAARLVWAAATIGTTPFGPRLHTGRALEMQWRSAMIRAAIEPGRTRYRRSVRYSRLDPSEKGAVSFFLGQAQAKLFAHDFFRVSRFVHYDSYLAHKGRPRRMTRPDFIGFYGRQVAIGVEAKGRSGSYDRALIDKAKKQVSSLPVIEGHPTSAAYIHVAHFDHDQLCAYLEDPPRQRQADVVDPAALTTAYYVPIVNAIRAQEQQNRGLETDDGSYLRAYFAEVDLHLAVRADIAELTPSDDRSGTLGARQGAADDLYELVLRMDEDAVYDEAAEGQVSDSYFLGGDGVAVELGPSWENWIEAGSV